MPDPEDVRWLQTTANELNNLLQLISESGQALERFLPTNEPEAVKFQTILRQSVERAVTVTRSIGLHASGQTPTPALSGTALSPATGLPAHIHVPEPVAPVEIHNPGGEKELILIVDDEEFITMLARHVLTDQGYRVVTAKNGFQALDVYRKLKEKIDLVILDFVMPIMDGADVFAELQQITPRVPVVLSSGFAEQDRLRGMLARGLRGFIPKPYTQQKLMEQVRQTLDAIRSEKQSHG